MTWTEPSRTYRTNANLDVIASPITRATVDRPLAMSAQAREPLSPDGVIWNNLKRRREQLYIALRATLFLQKAVHVSLERHGVSCSYISTQSSSYWLHAAPPCEARCLDQVSNTASLC